jgi:uncharacterized iron-regulated membrane protein
LNSILFRIHSWVGLIAGIVISVISLTGVSLVFRHELEDAFNPERSNLSVGSPLPLDSIRSVIGTMYGEYKLSAIILPEGNTAILARLAKDGQVLKAYLDPVTGTILDEQFESSDLLQQVFLLHRTLFAGETGKVIMFFFGLALIISTLTGLYIYRRQMVQFFRMLIRKGKLRKLREASKQWHTVIGMSAFIVNLLFGATGAIMQYPAVKKMFAEETKKQKNTPVVVASYASLDTMLVSAAIDHPDFHPRMFSFPADKDRTVLLRGKFGDDLLIPPARSSIEFSAQNGMILKVTNVLTGNIFDDATVIANPLHMGYWGGVFVKVLYVLMGICPGLLSVTGLVIMYKRLRKKRPLEDELRMLANEQVGPVSA